MTNPKSLTLRAFGDTDKELFRTWLYRDHVAKWYEHPLDWITEIEERNGAYAWIHHWIAEFGGAPVGFGQFYEYRRSGETWHGNIAVAGVYSMDYFIAEPACIGKGLGKALILALLWKIALQSNARLVIVQPAAENKASCGALLSAGFAWDEANRLYSFAL